MHKSLFTFGLLVGSLIMLAVMSFLNNNSFSNTAMAQGYDAGYGDSYSQYATDDKKYECQTGPFEGFFVSSVEFCKFKFDDKDRKDIRDNRTGTQGPPGPQGPPGLTGPQGPAGITQLNNTTTYNVTAPIVVSTVVDDAVGEGSAVCDSGDFAISGGYTLDNQSPNVPVSIVTNSLLDDNAWTVRTFSTAGDAGQSVVGGNVTANCFDNPPLKP